MALQPARQRQIALPHLSRWTGTIQGIVPKAAVPEEVFESIKKLTQESSVIVVGKVRADTRAPAASSSTSRTYRLVQRISEETPFPISLKEHAPTS